MAALTPENKIKERLTKRLNEMKVLHGTHFGGHYGNGGWPDKFVIVGGHYIGIEVKADSKKNVTPLQRVMLRRIEGFGGTSFVVYDDATIEEVCRYVLALSADVVAHFEKLVSVEAIKWARTHIITPATQTWKDKK